MAYFDIMVTPAKTDRMAEYKKLVAKSAKIWKKYGALSYVECSADDVKPGKTTSFPQSLKLKPDETVVVAMIGFKSRKHRDGVWGKMMKDPFMATFDMKTAPFDPKRMYFGGFKTLNKG
jgi:uncharacterized protein YbaA (DUF1428 family)